MKCRGGIIALAPGTFLPSTCRSPSRTPAAWHGRGAPQKPVNVKVLRRVVNAGDKLRPVARDDAGGTHSQGFTDSEATLTLLFEQRPPIATRLMGEEGVEPSSALRRGEF